MPPQPVLETERMLLRGFTPDDAAAVHGIVSEREIAANTLHIPHPYPDGMASEWIAGHMARWERGDGAIFACTLRGSGRIIAAVGLELDPPHRRGELGYWVARSYWNRGFATEGARAVVAWGFGMLGLHRVQATHYSRNPQSGAVMRKLGMRHEGTLRQHIYKWGVFEDLEVYGILAGELVRPDAW